MDDNGWIKIYRILADWEWYTDSHMVHLYIHLLISANSRDKRWRGIEVKRGQLVTSLDKLHAQTGISVRSLRTCLERLESTGEIEQKTTNAYRLITICKYGIYQAREEENDKQPTSERQTSDKQPTSERQATDNKQEYKKERIKEREEYKEAKASTSAFADAQAQPREGDDEIDFNSFSEFFNRTMDEAGAQISRLRTISPKRKAALRARCREHGKQALAEVIRKAARSDFLNGGGDRAFVADFDWLMRPNNFPKVLDGNYDNKQIEQKGQSNGTASNSTGNDRYAGLSPKDRAIHEADRKDLIEMGIDPDKFEQNQRKFDWDTEF